MSDFGIKRLAAENWLQPNLPEWLFVKLCRATGEVSPMTGEEWITLFLGPTLINDVPIEIRKMFEVARGALAYGFFFYPLYTFGSEQLFRIGEAAVTQKCRQIGTPRRADTFKKKLEHLRTNGFISEAEFNECDAIRRLRNEASHPQDQSIITPAQTALTLERISQKVNSLFISRARKSVLDEFQWPQSNDTIVSADGGKVLDPRWLSSNWLLFPEAYKQAADRLVDSLRDGGSSIEDDLIYPIIFLYRHFVETQLKSLALYVDQFAAERPPERMLRDHQLPGIWKYVRKQFEQLEGASVDRDVLETLERLIIQLAEIDSRSFNFRYPTDKELRPNPLPGPMSMANLRAVMARVHFGLVNMEQRIMVEVGGPPDS